MKRFGIIALSLLIIPNILLAYTSLGQPTGFVYDGAGLFSAEQKAFLEEKLSKFEADSTNEIAVVTIPSLEGDTIENFAIKLFEEWKIGKASVDNGILLLIARDDRKMRIEVGYGLEGSLTDALSAQIIRNTLTPAFKESRYYTGVSVALDEIIGATRGEYKVETTPFTENWVEWLTFWPFIAISVLIWLASILARSKSWWAGGVIGLVAGGVTSLIFGFLYLGIVALLFFVPIGLLLDYLVSNKYRKSISSGTRPPWWAGGSGRSGGGGGSSFGGFGGGGSGGGGASGGW